jgi:hypothetical protein
MWSRRSPRSLVEIVDILVTISSSPATQRRAAQGHGARRWLYLGQACPPQS